MSVKTLSYEKVRQIYGISNELYEQIKHGTTGYKNSILGAKLAHLNNLHPLPIPAQNLPLDTQSFQHEPIVKRNMSFTEPWSIFIKNLDYNRHAAIFGPAYSYCRFNRTYDFPSMQPLKNLSFRVELINLKYVNPLNFTLIIRIGLNIRDDNNDEENINPSVSFRRFSLRDGLWITRDCRGQKFHEDAEEEEENKSERNFDTTFIMRFIDTPRDRFNCMDIIIGSENLKGDAIITPIFG
jgi:hypothetical protein